MLAPDPQLAAVRENGAVSATANRKALELFADTCNCSGFIAHAWA